MEEVNLISESQTIEPYSSLEEIFNSITHGIGALISIAGTYTPFLLVTIRGVVGWNTLALILFLTVIGVLFKVFFVHRFKIISTIAYILMGWLVIFAIKPLFQALPGGGLELLICGVMAYTLGTIFYAWEKLPFNHAIWHLFVLTGSVCHFCAVMFYVIPLKV